MATCKRQIGQSGGGSGQVVPALVTSMLRATIRGSGKAVIAWTTVPPMPSP